MTDTPDVLYDRRKRLIVGVVLGAIAIVALRVTSDRDGEALGEAEAQFRDRVTQALAEMPPMERARDAADFLKDAGVMRFEEQLEETGTPGQFGFRHQISASGRETCVLVQFNLDPPHDPGFRSRAAGFCP